MPVLNYHRLKPDSQALVINTLLIILTTALLTGGLAYADTLDDELKKIEEKIEQKEKEYKSTSKKLSEVKELADSVAQKIAQLSSQLTTTQWEINSLQMDINQMEEELEKLEQILEERHQTLEEKILVRNTVIRNYSKRGILNDLEIFLRVLPLTRNLSGFQYSTYHYIFEKTYTTDMIALIGSINQEIADYEREKKEAEELKTGLEASQQSLLALRSQLAVQQQGEQEVLGGLESEKDSLEGSLSDLARVISELTSEQQRILAARSGEFSASLADGIDTDDPRTSIHFNPGFSPAFAAFSYGAYTHRNGMSQYGAKGRAEAGQSYRDIIKFYYDEGVREVSDFPSKLKVDGYGELDFQYYLYGLAEMPHTWPKEALRAQAIAARTYAYRYYKADKSICTTQSCQVFLQSKADNPPSEWKAAVDDTKNMIISGDTHAMYSSTTGGYINGIGWDVAGSWPNDAYERLAGSPWFFKAWFTQTYNRNSSTCNFPHPWLTAEEMADILNAYVLLKSGVGTSRILPETINKCPIGGMSGDPYSKTELRNRAADQGISFTRVTNVTSVMFGTGRTNSVTFSTDSGSYTVDGQLFMRAFNLRAPGYIAIKYTPDNKAIYSIEVK
jgi:peptidoglycan hydrolase CwlO-like protein